ncbi:MULTISPECIES: pirin family protein [unclassified Chitinophaga]|uniref:pirin family protein n=1 Tax=unclassified Chitinophaga TaxID=2619133 RepID=UPI0009D3260A|nr:MULTISPECIES: pirin family protein [unclassified Chitinophaga]OMP78076.1 hypothetical protein BW716_16740 [[Flexibacter] sp. ATCC 35208]WPV65778.1 pirin family protein [Chitinophaga sp. LS1]
MKKDITHILDGRSKNITATQTVLQPLPHADFRFASPFIVLHHGGPDVIPKGSDSRIHPHPHRGFAPVTFQLQGQAHHKDSFGNDQLLNAGDAQWMFAGKGILHSEGPSEQEHRNGGVEEILQLWVNVPAANKWDDPKYQFAHKSAMPIVLDYLRLVSGNFDGKTGPVNISYTPVISAVGEVPAGKTLTFNVVANYWTLVYIAHGSVKVNEVTEVAEHHLIVFDKTGDEFTITTTEDTQLLFLSGEVIDEPVAAKDNFVMSTMADVDQAIEDYKNGLFGTLNY